jgi:hypothetical protein
VRIASAKTISKWFQDTSDSDADKVALFSIPPNQVKIQLGEWKNYEPEAVVPLIWEQATGFANATGGVKAFMLQSFDTKSDAPQNPLSTLPFTIHAEAVSGADQSMGSEPATADGLLAMSMRMSGELFRNFNSMMGSCLHYMSRTIERLEGQVEEGFNFRLQMLDTVENLQSRKHEREMSMKALEAKGERDKELFSRVTAYLPVAINHLAGKELIRQRDTELELVSMELASQLTMPQLDKMRESGLLSPQQLVLLATMLEKTTKRMQTMDEAVKNKADADKAANQPGATP